MEENKTLNEQLPEEQPSAAEEQAVEVVTVESRVTVRPKKKLGLIIGIVAGVVLLAILATVIFFVLKDNKDFTRNAFIDELGGVCDTFNGAVSEKTYYTANQAAREFVHQEVAGDDKVSIISVISHGTADASDVIPAEFLEGSNRAEKLEVEFSRPSTASYGDGVQAIASGNGSNNEKVTVYVIKYGIMWRYYTPMPSDGEVLNQSYFTSVFDDEKYQNCTLEWTQKSKAGPFGLIDFKSDTKVTIKIQENRLYIEQIIKIKESNKSREERVNVYLEKTRNDNLKCYIQENGGEWIYHPNGTIALYSGLYVIRSIDEFAPFFDHSHFDQSYFNKTDYGFEVAEENLKDYFMDTYLWREYNKQLRNNGFYLSDEDIDLNKIYAEYFVQDGTLTGVRMSVKGNFHINRYGADLPIYQEHEYAARITNCGTTVIERPDID